MSAKSSIYVEVEADAPDSVFLIRRDERANGHREEFLRIPNDLIKTAIEQLLRVLPEPSEEPSSAAETENAVFPTALCEQDPDDDDFCAYHHVWHAGRPY